MTKKVFKIIFVITLILISTISSVRAASILDNVLSDGKKFQTSANKEVIKQSAVKPVSDTVYNVLAIIGVVVAVIAAAVLGIKYMLGSMEEQAKIKETIVPFIAGCIVIFGAFTIWKLIVDIVQGAGV